MQEIIAVIRPLRAADLEPLLDVACRDGSRLPRVRERAPIGPAGSFALDPVAIEALGVTAGDPLRVEVQGVER